MIVGIGVDVVDLARFERAVGRTPGLVDRLFAPAERGLPLRSLAGRFAAKEALLKALGATDGVRWHDMQVVSDAEGNPDLRVSGRAAQIAASRGIAHLHVSMSHDAGVATAFVVAESDDSDPADSDPAAGEAA
ncbi:holo-ACP synthase [Chryseoglobus sp. 28M-23]|uniref:holo-ACP synthase n=1 Tax=Chryseoglobus sp. 28M-23 TaxID=2772253 RepID=UPI001747AE51|nr:holo-ACP synthase [Chryseoglobus sp. 28M-23]MBU1250136.1 holo-ACP synthase [Actinomycetota bacterium]MBU1608119.1 holo-ACP synthase [Actinomycetota bacterium]MBU2315081.1 holo-ACP synthase [Actinomycetota bacterium]MBU2383910.1 holo-ACP synthase [Actinomycetota bacterium]QOD93896.1 holo-ACP synthase [Chryseoglobus sp. 28M-23]